MKTRVLVDNTSLAGCGRVLYSHPHPAHPGKEGAAHANSFYSANPENVELDWTSFSEFLTAFVLFDEIVWDSSSCNVDSENNDLFDYRWLYDWFPIFDELFQNQIVTEVSDQWVASSGGRLDRARHIAMGWVKSQVASGTRQLPVNFRVPLSYYSSDYYDYNVFRHLNEEYQLSESDLATAAFVHRGLFYLGRTHSEPGVGYLPHSFRATLLRDPAFSVLSVFCNDQLCPTVQSIDPITIIRDVGDQLARAVNQATEVPGLTAHVAIGSAFCQVDQGNPWQALAEAQVFRDSIQGAKLRRWFSELIELGNDSNKMAIRQRIADVETELRQFAAEKLGGRVEKISLLDPIPVVGRLVNALVPSLPREWSEGLNRVLNRRIGPHTGMQLIFDYYLPDIR